MWEVLYGGDCFSVHCGTKKMLKGSDYVQENEKCLAGQCMNLSGFPNSCYLSLKGMWPLSTSKEPDPSTVNVSWTGAPLMRLMTTHYSDGVFEIKGLHLPSARHISNTVARGPSGHLSVQNRTVLSVFFGESHISHSVSARNPPGFFDCGIIQCFILTRQLSNLLVAIRFSCNGWDCGIPKTRLPFWVHGHPNPKGWPHLWT